MNQERRGRRSAEPAPRPYVEPHFPSPQVLREEADTPIGDALAEADPAPSDIGLRGLIRHIPRPTDVDPYTRF